MQNLIDRAVLKRLREQKGWTQNQLADKAGLTKQSIYRLEKGQQPGRRKKTVEGLCKALGVEEDVLTGKREILDKPRRETEPDSLAKHQLNVRIGGDVRNAFTLTALRYRIPISRIVELAPLLFTLTAEQSLERRRRLIADFRSLHEAFKERGGQLRRSWPNVDWAFNIVIGDEDSSFDEAIEQEEEAITSRNLFEPTVFSEYDFDKSPDSIHGPFTEYLLGIAEECFPDVEIYQFTSQIEYEICRHEALEISGDDAGVANSILNGEILIQEIPKNLLSPEKAEQRLDWLKNRIDKVRADRQNFR